jgi:hypothetical protein
MIINVLTVVVVVVVVVDADVVVGYPGRSYGGIVVSVCVVVVVLL